MAIRAAMYLDMGDLMSAFPGRLAYPVVSILAFIVVGTLLLAPVAAPSSYPSTAQAQQETPTLLDPNLRVRAVVTGLTQPTTMAFLGPDDMLVLEKSTGQVQRVVGGVVRGPVLDLA